MPNSRAANRLRQLAEPRLAPNETMICWSRVWHSRASRVQVLAARYRDIAVLTDRQLMLFEVGMFSRLPRRRVLVDRLDELTVEDVSRARNGSRVRFGKPGHKAVLIECNRRNSFGRRLLEAAGRRVGDSGDNDGTGVRESDSPVAAPVSIDQEAAS
jgi:hypothetical protein